MKLPVQYITSSKKRAYPCSAEGAKGSVEREREFLSSVMKMNKSRPESTRPHLSSLRASTTWDGQNREAERITTGKYGRIDIQSSLFSIFLLFSSQRSNKKLLTTYQAKGIFQKRNYYFLLILQLKIEILTLIISITHS